MCVCVCVCNVFFTNVSVHETIKMIIENVYNHPSIPPPVIQPKLLENLLLTCITKVPFYNPSDNIFIQINGISMGSPLGPTIPRILHFPLRKQNI